MEQVILVTGASGGIGAATAKRIAKSGKHIVVHFHHGADKAAEVAALIVAEGGRALALGADLTNEAELLTLFAEVDKLGQLTGLVNNAGIITPIASFREYSAARVEQVMKVNVVAPILCAREAVARMSTELGGSGGAIVNVSSSAARMGSPNEFIDYAASKGALDTFTLGLAKEVAQQGIRVNSVRPGLIDTILHAHAGAPNRCQDFSQHIPMGRAGTVDEVAANIDWLLSDQASYVTGAILDVSGGR